MCWAALITANFTMLLDDFYAKVMRFEAKCFEFLQSHGLYYNTSLDCPGKFKITCGSKMILKPRKVKGQLLPYFRCGIKKCRAMSSIRKRIVSSRTLTRMEKPEAEWVYGMLCGLCIYLLVHQVQLWNEWLCAEILLKLNRTGIVYFAKLCRLYWRKSKKWLVHHLNLCK